MNHDKYKYLKFLSSKARNNPSTWVIDPTDGDEPDYTKPSKDRLNAYQLDGTRKIIYLSDKDYTPLIREDWREEKAEERYQQRCTSLDELHDEYDFEPDSDGNLINKDNYYLYINNEVDASFDDANDYIIAKIEFFLLTLSGADKMVTDLLKKGKTQRDIAPILGISQPAVNKRIKKLKKDFDIWLSKRE